MISVWFRRRRRFSAIGETGLPPSFITVGTIPFLLAASIGRNRLSAFHRRMVGDVRRRGFFRRTGGYGGRGAAVGGYRIRLADIF